MMNGRVSIVFMALLLSVPAPAGAGGLPRLDWSETASVDWSSGYAIAYGSGRAPDYLKNHTRRRAAARKAAYLEASRSLIRLCLSLRVESRMTVRDYYREDPELQERFRAFIRSVAPWEIRLGGGERVSLALRLPLCGAGGLAGTLGEEEHERAGDEEADTGAWPPAAVFEEDLTGIVLVAGDALVPAVHPLILGSGGRVLVEYGGATAAARERPSYLAYYDDIAAALADPVVGRNPVVDRATPSEDGGSDLRLTETLEARLLASQRGRDVLENVKIVVVLEGAGTP